MFISGTLLTAGKLVFISGGLLTTGKLVAPPAGLLASLALELVDCVSVELLGVF